MAAILASHSCYCRNVELSYQGRTVDNLNFSSSVSVNQIIKIEKTKTGKLFRVHIEARQAELPNKYGENGKPVKMVPTSEIMKRNPTSVEHAESINGSKRAVNGSKLAVNGSKRGVNGSKQVVIEERKVDRDSSVLIKSLGIKKSDELPPVEELKVLPSDESFSWANENYNSVQRSIDVWSFILSLRVRVLLDNAKWAYVGGLTEDKQASLLH